MAQETKHTSGPWKVKLEPREINATINARGLCIAQVWSGQKEVTMEVVEANACLIAKSPKLLEMLEIFVDAYNFKANEIPDSDLDPEQPKHIMVTLGDLNKARRIIKEARGI